MKRNTILWIVTLCATVAMTNRYTDLDADAQIVRDAAGDSYSYAALADAAPGLPTDSIAFHHAQRIAVPFAVGLAHRVLPAVSTHRVFQIAVFVFALAILVVLAGIFGANGVDARTNALILSGFAFNPWAFRFYVTFPEMVNDLGFALGVTVIVRGLLSGKAGRVIGGQVLASLCRQTGLLLIPAIVIWVWRERSVWHARSRQQRILLCTSVAMIALAVYFATGVLAATFSLPSENAGHVFGMVSWIAHDFDPAVLATAAARILAVLAVPGVIMFAMFSRARTDATAQHVWLLLAITALCAAQPILAGPAFTGGNGERLAGLGFVPALVAAAFVARDAAGGRVFAHRSIWIVMFVLLLLGSAHHLYVSPMLPHPGTRTGFAVLYACVCAGLFAVILGGRLTLTRCASPAELAS